jgi:hypothetical protein
MANIPNDPYRQSDAPYRSPYADDARDSTRIDNDLQIDPELAEGPPNGGRVAAYALAIAVVLGAVFYGLNHTSLDQAGTSSTAQNTAQTGNNAQPAAPPGMRDVTPRANSNGAPGVTTGSANRPIQPAPNSTGSDQDQSANPFNGQGNDNR